jgi:hypothetical protein
MSAMTAVTSPKDLITAYRTKARQNALAQGSPIDRSAFPGLSLEPTGMIFLRGKKAIYKPTTDTAKTLDADLLVELLTTKDASTVVADHATYNKLLVIAENLPSSDNKALARRLRIAEGLPGSVKLPILTRALAYRYWLPEGLDEQDFDQWAEAFDVKGPTPAITMRALMALARSANTNSAALNFKAHTFKLEDLERRLYETAPFGGRANDNYIFDMLDQYGAIHAGIRSIDPGLLEMHVLDGTVCRIVPQNVGFKEFTASVSNPFKLKEGAKVRLTDGFSVAECHLEKLRFSSNQLSAQFSRPGNKTAGPLMIDQAKAGAGRLYVTDVVYASYSKGPTNKRWTSGSIEPITGRQVPMDVMIAGAPTGD